MSAVFAIAAGAALIAAIPSSKGCSGFDGAWKTAWSEGTTGMRIHGRKGTYDYKNGQVAGTIDGRVFFGRYTQSNGAGTFSLTLAPDGNSFKGSYRTDAAETGPWTGVCSGPA